MGIVFEKRHEYGAAIKAFSDCVRIRGLIYGEESLEMAEVLISLGSAQGNLHNFAGALRSWDQALYIYQRNELSEDHPLVVTVLDNRAIAERFLAETK
mmetsp:Transcript_39191/g.59059  ORF Transcript_39191/g.59059 Transcript_39191/m.59059 type:complete len:98 (+) Transcript_39191:92-385(+)